MRPAKYIDYAELAASRVELDELNAFTARKTPWYKRDPLAKREKEDYRRFMSVVGKHIVFYSERSGFTSTSGRRRMAAGELRCVRSLRYQRSQRPGVQAA